MQQQSQVINSSTSTLNQSTDFQKKVEQTPSEVLINEQSSNRIKRRQFVALIVLSLIGAEFGQDVNANKSQAPNKTIPQGFSLEDHSILKRISNFILFIKIKRLQLINHK